MNESPSHNLDGVATDIARRIDEVCRRFEADVRQGRQPRIEDYLVNMPHDGRRALEAELEALERELRASDQTVARPAAGPCTAPEPQPTTNPSTIAEAPSIAPGPPPSSVHEEATVPPSNPPRTAHDEPTGAVLGQDPSATPGGAEPTRIRFFGDYEILREIARGGMGVVFQARQVSLNRTVALKMILAGQLADETDVKRFLTEAEAAANLDHPGIVPIYEVGEHEGQHYFSMGFIEGQSLSQRLAGGPLPAREAAELVRRVSEAIEYAHEHGVIHRDLKPANILLDQNGYPRITDFGLTKKIQGDSGLTGSGQIMGTPSYMPPEQAGGKRGEVGPPADVYALGATLYALLTGRPPFQAATAMDTVIQVITDEPVPPRRLNPSVPRDLETICLRCLEKEPMRRYETARALAGDLGRWLRGEPIQARPACPFERMAKWSRRRPAAATLSVVSVAMALTLVGTAVAWRYNGLLRRSLVSETAQRGEAERQRARAEDHQLAAHRYQYAADIALAWVSWDQGRLARTVELLDRHRPDPGADDLRGFEWYYLRRLARGGRITLRGAGPLTSVAYSPDGKTVTSLIAQQDLPAVSHDTGAASKTAGQTSEGFEATVWDLATGRPLSSTRIPVPGPRARVKLSPDGRTLASTQRELITRVVANPNGQASRDSSWVDDVVSWDVITGKPHVLLKGLEGGECEFTPDSRTLAVLLPDGSIKMLDILSGQTRQTLRPKKAKSPKKPRTTDGPWLLAFSTDGKVLLSARTVTEAGVSGIAFQTKLTLWDIGRGVERDELELPMLVGQAALSSDGGSMALNLAALGGENTLAAETQVQIWDTSPPRLRTTLQAAADDMSSMVYAPDGKTLATAGNDAVVRVWDAASGKPRSAFKGHSELVIRLAFSPDGRFLASGARDRMIQIWDAANDQESTRLAAPTGAVVGIAFSPDGRSVVTASRGGVPAVGPAVKGQKVSAPPIKGEVAVFETATGVRRSGFTVDHLVLTMALSPDGKTLVTAGGVSGTREGLIKLWNLASGSETAAYRPPMPGVISLAFSPDGRTLALRCETGMIQLWDVARGRPRSDLRGHANAVYGLAFSPDGATLASASWDKTIRLWNAADGRERVVLSGHSHWVNSVAFSPDGMTLASATAFSGEGKLWEVGTGKERKTLPGATGSLAFAPDGRSLATCGGKSATGFRFEILIWQVATGQELLRLPGHRIFPNALAFAPDGSALASVSGSPLPTVSGLRDQSNLALLWSGTQSGD